MTCLNKFLKLFDLITNCNVLYKQQYGYLNLHIVTLLWYVGSDWYDWHQNSQVCCINQLGVH
ncbi:hypothetical protein C0J52_00678 [Blattella germanica]|nr:hypothetical protein C0J52_00678 [Blattella germanica]